MERQTVIWGAQLIIISGWLVTEVWTLRMVTARVSLRPQWFFYASLNFSVSIESGANVHQNKLIP
jgi:hypothetical protein